MSTQTAKNQFNQSTPESVLPNDTLVYALGGMNEVGKNMYCIEHDDEIIIIDAGVMFPGENLLGVDYVIPDFNYLIRHQRKIKALIITHGHEDHIGGIPFLLRVVKPPHIYAPEFAKALIDRKLGEHRMSQHKVELIDGDSRIQTKHFTVGFFEVIHSIPDAFGLIVTTPNGRIATTGDFKFDLTPVGNNSDYQKIAFLGASGVDLLLSDSTNSEVRGFSISELDVANQLKEVFDNTQSRIIVATFASNVFRVSQIIDAAIGAGRRVAVFGRSMERVVEIGRAFGHIKARDKDFLSPKELNSTPAEKVCILCTGSQGEALAALSRIANGTHRQIKIHPGDTVIFSSNPIPGNAQSVSGVVNKLTRLGANVLTNSILNELHTTGHASKEEQKLMLQLIRPNYFLPMHGEYKMLIEHGKTAVEVGIPKDNIFICANGDPLILRNHEVLRANQRIQADDIYVDGKDASGLSTAVIKDRKILSDNGLVSVIVTIDSRYNKILVKPNIVSRGFVYLKDSVELMKDAENLVYDALKKQMKTKTTFGEIKRTIRDTLEPFLFQKTQRSPIVIPVIMNMREAMAPRKD
ncbi:MAG TPA: ribonuclease J [Erysipelothrix sp.]|nr:ribonuclease J [Erysipelothrix sp.]